MTHEKYTVVDSVIKGIKRVKQTISIHGSNDWNEVIKERKKIMESHGYEFVELRNENGLLIMEFEIWDSEWVVEWVMLSADHFDN
jgi:hypothetical protein